MKTACALADSMQTLPPPIRVHMEVCRRACVVAMQRFRRTISVAASDAATALKASHFSLAYEIVYHRLLKHGASDALHTSAQLPPLPPLPDVEGDVSNVFARAVVTLPQVVTRLRAGAGARAVLEQQGQQPLPLPLLCDAVLVWCV